MDTKKAIKQLQKLKELLQDKNLRLAAEWDKKWKILISTILSAQTKDEKTIEISHILYKKYPIAKRLGEAGIKDIEKIIMPVNYYQKIKNSS